MSELAETSPDANIPRGSFIPPKERRRRDEHIAALAVRGIKPGRIGEIVGLSRTRVRAIMALYGISRPVGRPRKDQACARSAN